MERVRKAEAPLNQEGGLRGAAVDIFGCTDERGLIKDYETTLARFTSGLTPQRLPTAIQIGAIPQKIRGYGHIKGAFVGPAKAEEKALWGGGRRAGEKVLVEA